MDEVWKPVHIPLYSDCYEVSSLGRVRRVHKGKKHIRLGHYAKYRILHWQITNGYLYVTLSRYAILKAIQVHILVANAFIGPPPKGKLVSHKDNNGLNPRLDNLEYTTQLENLQNSKRWMPIVERLRANGSGRR